MWKSTSELGYVNLDAIEQLRRQHRVDGVGRRNFSTRVSTRGSFVKCSIKGSSVDSETSRPLLKYFGNGDLEKSRNNRLLDSGDIAMPIRAR